MGYYLLSAETPEGLIPLCIHFDPREIVVMASGLTLQDIAARGQLVLNVRVTELLRYVVWYFPSGHVESIQLQFLPSDIANMLAR